ncbi:MAG TPA: hypothetical protein VK943_00350 [Arenibaculum sp.]|nr:hypothetical protein [Arenibaculum sp.]
MSGKGRSFAPPPISGPAGRRAWPAAAGTGAGTGGGTVQAFKTFDALRTGKAERGATGDELVPLHDGRFHLRTAERGLHVRPNGTYNFVRVHGTTRNDMHTFVSTKASHAKLASGRPVLYAGTLSFRNGMLDWWTNYSGTYQPVAAFRGQAALPDDRFVPWQRMQMGGSSMQRNMFADRRDAAPPPAVERPRPAHPGTPARTAEAPDVKAASPSAPVTRKTGKTET